MSSISELLEMNHQIAVDETQEPYFEQETRLELATPTLARSCSNQLSYSCIFHYISFWCKVIRGAKQNRVESLKLATETDDSG